MNHWLDTTIEAHRRYFRTPARPIIYEVGSRDGNDGVELAERLLEGQGGIKYWDDIVLVEPNPPQQEVIRQAYPNATLVPFAVLDEEITSNFVQIAGDINEIGTSSLDIDDRETKSENRNVIQVQTKTMATILHENLHAFHNIAIMKVDTEGYTWEVLQSLKDHLSQIEVLHLETEVEGLARNKTNLEVFEFMRNAGFLCYAREHEWGAGIEDQVWVNAELAIQRVSL